ncbi:hypothetical protein BC332_18521 [Capsicum chinense]|nr:hypothetical protein BC332_18521 [Capsicum chinense]
MFHWVLDIVVLIERPIRVYDSMLGRRRSGPLSEIQKLAKIFPTYFDIHGFCDQKIRTNWSTLEAYQNNMGNPFDVEYVEGIAQQSSGSLDCSLFVIDGLKVPNNGLDTGLLCKRYAILLWKYGEVKIQNHMHGTLKIHDDQSRIP